MKILHFIEMLYLLGSAPMYRKSAILFYIIILFTIFICCPLPVSAHSGRTDSDGGHTNHSTGEYHWHHGYSAHQHKDLDGDGYPEYCPFKQQSNATSSSSNFNDCGRKNCTIEGRHTHAKNNQSDTFTLDHILGIGFVVILCSSIFGPLISDLWKNKIYPIIKKRQ
jgi:hypothetical protein